MQRVTGGERGGRENVTLNVANMPSHSHTIINQLTVTPQCNAAESDTDDPTAAFLGPAEDDTYAATSNASMAPFNVGGTITAGNTGNGQSFNIENPFLGIYHVIALVGVFPSRN